jgi:hypothetical protein
MHTDCAITFTFELAITDAERVMAVRASSCFKKVSVKYNVLFSAARKVTLCLTDPFSFSG